MPFIDFVYPECWSACKVVSAWSRKPHSRRLFMLLRERMHGLAVENRTYAKGRIEYTYINRNELGTAERALH